MPFFHFCEIQFNLCTFINQGSHIRIYDVEHDWKVHKDIIARSMRWTITDTSLSPDQRFLVSAYLHDTILFQFSYQKVTRNRFVERMRDDEWNIRNQRIQTLLIICFS